MSFYKLSSSFEIVAVRDKTPGLSIVFLCVASSLEDANKSAPNVDDR